MASAQPLLCSDLEVGGRKYVAPKAAWSPGPLRFSTASMTDPVAHVCSAPGGGPARRPTLLPSLGPTGTAEAAAGVNASMDIAEAKKGSVARSSTNEEAEGDFSATSAHLASNKAPPSHKRFEAGDVFPLSRVILLTTLVWFAVGWVLFVGKDKLSQRDRFEGIGAVLYWQVQIITTVGYGDLYPETDGKRLVVAIYVLVGNMVAGVGVMDYLTNMLTSGAEATKKDLLSKSLAKSVGAWSEPQDDAQPLARSTHELAEAKARHAMMHKYGPLVKALLGFLGMISIGTVFFSCVDYCVCEDFDNCDVVIPFWEAQRCLDLEDDAKLRSISQAFYMSCITLTTVGFGDGPGAVPGNWLGRLFAIFWMSVGVASMANFLGHLAHAVTANYVKRSIRQGMSDSTFRMIDADGSGSLTKYEYVVYMLMNFDMVDADDVQDLIDGFDDMDLNGNGLLEYREVMVHGRRHD